MKHVKPITAPVRADFDFNKVWPWLVGIALAVFGVEQFLDKETATT